MPLRGKGGNRSRGDNGVSPLPPEGTTRKPQTTLTVLPRPAQKPGQNVDQQPAKRAARTKTAKRPSQAAALEWRDLQLPVIGRLWAGAWLPLVLVAGLFVALMYLLQTSGVATTGYDIQRLQAERDDWQLRNEQLQLELAKRRSLTWIESEATGRLGMVPAQPTALTYVKDTR
jgi:hypothetical protein